MINMYTTITQSAPVLMQGMLTTITLWLIAVVLSLSIGTVLGIVRCRRGRIALLSPLLDVITFVLRGIPFYVQLLISYFLLPDLLNINLPSFAAASLSLGLCSAAYLSQIVRGGIDALPVGQWEAAQVLGYSQPQTLRYIILPQMIRNILPALGGEFDQLLKTTAVVSAIGVLDLTRAGMNIIAREMNPIMMYSIIALCYLFMSSLLNGVTALLERRLWSC